MAMNPEIKAEWVKALRSGDYKQGKRVLRREDDTYCCLGVLCELAVKAGAIGPPRLDRGAYDYGSTRDSSAMFLPESVERWPGALDRPDDDETVISDLMGYNDEGQDFAYIADQIERRL